MMRAFVTKDFRLLLSYRFVLVLNLVAVFFGIATYYFLGEAVTAKLDAYGDRYFEFLLVGIAVSTLLTAVMNGLATQLAQEISFGTLEMLLAAPMRPLTCFGLLSFWNLLQAFGIALLYVVVGAVGFGFRPAPESLWPCLLLLLLSLVAFYGLGLIAAAFILRFKRGNPIQWVLGSLQVLLGGVYFPLTALPAWLLPFAKLLPLAHAIDGMRQATLLNAPWSTLMPSILYLALLAAILLPVGMLGIQLSVNAVLRHGSFQNH